jgi:hypothetical protein
MGTTEEDWLHTTEASPWMRAASLPAQRHLQTIVGKALAFDGIPSLNH